MLCLCACVHAARSYLGYGLMAARAKVIEAGKDDPNHPCFAKGSSLKYSYAGECWWRGVLSHADRRTSKAGLLPDCSQHTLQHFVERLCREHVHAMPAIEAAELRSQVWAIRFQLEWTQAWPLITVMICCLFLSLLIAQL